MSAIVFDMFGTLVDMSGTPREEIRDYLRQCVDPVWHPMDLPDSWRKLKAFPDAEEGLRRLGEQHTIGILSNGSLPVVLSIMHRNGLVYDKIINLSERKRYKPHPACYLHAAGEFGQKPENCIMVTANPTFGPYPFGDIQIAGAIGMQARLIRNPGGPADLIALAEELGC